MQSYTTVSQKYHTYVLLPCASIEHRLEWAELTWAEFTLDELTCSLYADYGLCSTDFGITHVFSATLHIKPSRVFLILTSLSCQLKVREMIRISDIIHASFLIAKLIAISESEIRKKSF